MRRYWEGSGWRWAWQEGARPARRAALYERAAARLNTLQKQAERDATICAEQGHSPGGSYCHGAMAGADYALELLRQPSHSTIFDVHFLKGYIRSLQAAVDVLDREA